MNLLDYKKLLKDYNEALNTRLRGFGPLVDYLDTWVPDNDHVKSIVNLAEAAELAGKGEVGLCIGQPISEQIDAAILETQLKKITQNIVISQTNSGKNSALNVVIKFGNKNAQLKTGNKAPNEKPIEPSPYRFALSARLGNMEFHHFGNLSKQNGEKVFIDEKLEGIQLSLLIETKTSIITDAKFFCESPPETKALWELFCMIIQGLPIQEAADHATIKLEHFLRDRSRKSSIQGIITPWNADPMFKYPMLLIRKCYLTFKDKTGFKERTNFYDKMPSNEWSSLSSEEKISRIQNYMNNFLKNSVWSKSSLKVIRLDGQGQTRIYCILDDLTLNAPQIAELLMKLEWDLRQNVEARIEIFMEEKKDLNSKRRL